MDTLLAISSLVAHVIALASVIVKITPTEVDDEVLQKVINLLKVVSLAK
jgi:hypothetical protein